MAAILPPWFGLATASKVVMSLLRTQEEAGDVGNADRTKAAAKQL